MQDRSLAPHRALLHPLWLASLVVLALNDHVFKSAGVLPDVITGKLSDFAGLLVAPALLAALTRVQTRRGWWLAHLAVGAVFSAIQLSPEVAAIWSRGMAAIGVPWVIVCDPTDLIALPILLVGGRVLARGTRATVVSNLRRSAECAAATVGLVFCTATSYDEPWDAERFEELFADVYLHNGTSDELVVRIRPLSPSVDYDCSVVARDPGRLLHPRAFGRGQAWSLRPGANMALLDEGASRECYAFLVDADDFAPVVVFWTDGSPARTWISGQGIDASAPGWISMSHDTEGRGIWDSERELFWLGDATPEPPTEACRPPTDATRLDWSSMPNGPRTLARVETTIDGCLALDLVSDDAGEGSTTRSYLCVPESVFPFRVGDRFVVSNTVQGASGWVEGLTLHELPHDESDELPLRELVISRGNAVPPMLELDASFRPDLTCSHAVEPTCGTAARVGSIVVRAGNELAELRSGDAPVSLAADDHTSIAVFVAHATERAVLDPECARGADSLGFDIEIAAARHRTAH